MEYISGCEPKFDIGDKVWCVERGPCPSVKEEPETVDAIFCVQVNDGLVCTHGLVCTGYRISLWNTSAGSDFDKWIERELFTDYDEAKRLCERLDVTGITDDEWHTMIGSRDDESHMVAELGPCCTGISEIRDILLNTQKHGSICRRDIELIKSIAFNSGHQEIYDDPSNEFPLLGKVFAQIGIS